MINVFILEDHLLIAYGIKHFFRNSSRISVVGFSANIDEAIGQITQLKPSVIIMDLFINRNDPVKNFHLLSVNFPSIPVIILSGETSLFWQTKMMLEGAKGYVVKEPEQANLKETIIAVSKGHVVSPGSPTWDKKHFYYFDLCKYLYAKDLRILQLLSTGLTMKEVSEKLGISYSTITNRINEILILFDAKTTYELIRIFFEQRIFSYLEEDSRLVC